MSTPLKRLNDNNAKARFFEEIGIPGHYMAADGTKVNPWAGYTFKEMIAELRRLTGILNREIAEQMGNISDQRVDLMITQHRDQDVIALARAFKTLLTEENRAAFLPGTLAPDPNFVDPRVIFAEAVEIILLQRGMSWTGLTSQAGVGKRDKQALAKMNPASQKKVITALGFDSIEALIAAAEQPFVPMEISLTTKNENGVEIYREAIRRLRQYHGFTLKQFYSPDDREKIWKHPESSTKLEFQGGVFLHLSVAQQKIFLERLNEKRNEGEKFATFDDALTFGVRLANIDDAALNAGIHRLAAERGMDQETLHKDMVSAIHKSRGNMRRKPSKGLRAEVHGFLEGRLVSYIKSKQEFTAFPLNLRDVEAAAHALGFTGDIFALEELGKLCIGKIQVLNKVRAIIRDAEPRDGENPNRGEKMTIAERLEARRAAAQSLNR